MSEHPPTDEQAAIIRFVAKTNDSLLVEALAGSGKTSTVLMALMALPQPTALLVAFNKRIADELKDKLPPMPRGRMVMVKTFHALGLGIIKKHYPRVQVSADATEQLINKAAGGSITFKMRRAAVRLLRQFKEMIVTSEPPSFATAHELGLEYNLFGKNMAEPEIELAIETARDAYHMSLDMVARETIDFCDMTWAPVACKLDPPGRYKAVFVDELQDISAPQFELMMKMLAPGGRMIGVGDENQQIYDFRGSLGAQAWVTVKARLNAKMLPLTQTFRCAKAIVREANQLVPALRAAPNAPEGRVTECRWLDLPSTIGKVTPFGEDNQFHTFVLSRNNADLLECALFLWRERTRFQLNAGKEMLEPIFDLLDRLDLFDETRFRKSLEKWYAIEFDKATKANAAARADQITEQLAMLRTAVLHAHPNKIKSLLAEIIAPNPSGVLLSTVHKVKGLEADRVFLLRQTFARHEERDPDDPYIEPDQEELNIEYVAITRAKNHLVWVNMARAVVVANANLDPRDETARFDG